MKRINAHIGTVLQKYRIKNHFTQNEAAEIADMEPRYISQIERGISKGSIDTLLKLCNAYKITPDVVLYDLLNKDIKESVKIHEERYKKLAIKDRETIDELINYFLRDE